MRTLMTVVMLGWLVLGNSATGEMRIRRDIPYATHAGDARRTSVDIYSPAAGTGHPVLIWIHGGAWRIGDKRAVQEKPQALVDHGYVFVSMNYRLYPDADFRQQAGDVARAIRWVRDHIGADGGDPNRVFLMGHSAGAHLAALVATDDRYLKSEELSLDAIRGVVLLDGAGYDIPRQIRWTLGETRQLFTSVFGEDEQVQRAASPISHVARGKGIPPFLIVHVADRLASLRQSTLLADALRQAGGAATVFAAKDKTHATVNRELGLAGDPPTAEVFAFLDGILQAGSAAAKTAVTLSAAESAAESAATSSSAKPTDRLYKSSLTVDGLTRSYQLFVPSKKEPLPLVFVFHGGGGDAEKMVAYTQFHELARGEGFIVCYPHALEANWNDGRNVAFFREHRENIDDVQFTRALIDEIAKAYPLDRSRVFATGASNGGIMSHRLAAEAADMIAAIAPVIGGLAKPIAGDFKPSHPVSLFVIQGDADPLVPIDGGSVGFRLGRKRGEVISTTAAVSLYLKRNQITAAPTASALPDADPNDGTTTQASVYPPGVDGARVQVYIVHNGGHTWPGKPGYAAERVIGKASQDFDATKAIWEFFKSCPPRQLE